MAARWIAFHVTDRCQLDCQHCLRDPSQKPTDLGVDLIARVLDQGVRHYAIEQVSLTGGEPTLHPELPRIVDAIVDRGLAWHLVTNGKRFGAFIAMLEERPPRIAGLTGVNISVDGASEEVHDGIRGAGSYRDVLTAVSIAKVKEIDFSLNLTINAHNVHELEAFAFKAAQLGAKRVQFNMLQATGTMHDEVLGLPRDEWERVLDRIARLKDSLRVVVEPTEGFPRDDRFHVCDPFRSAILHVDVQGRLNLCCQHSGVPAPEGHPRTDVAGHLAEMSLPRAHARLLDIVNETMKARLDHLEKASESGAVDGWDRYGCNWCMKHFGKPHWTDRGTAGASAARERWNGAWDEAAQEERKRRRLPLARS